MRLFWFSALGHFTFLLAHNIERHVAQHGQILRSVVHAVASGVFTHGDVETLVQPILHAPIVAHDQAPAFRRDLHTGTSRPSSVATPRSTPCRFGSSPSPAGALSKLFVDNARRMRSKPLAHRRKPVARGHHGLLICPTSGLRGLIVRDFGRFKCRLLFSVSWD